MLVHFDGPGAHHPRRRLLCACVLARRATAEQDCDVIPGVNWPRARRVTLDFKQPEVAQVSFGAFTEATVLSAAAASRPRPAPAAISVSHGGSADQSDEGCDSGGDYVETFDKRDVARVVGPTDPVLCFVRSTDPPDPEDTTVPHPQRVDALRSEFAQAFTDPKGVPARSFH